MEGKGNISDYRSKLDKSLASPDLINDEKLQTLVRNQILQSSQFQSEGCIENVVERRSKEVSNFLSMLRSASVNDVEMLKSSEDSPGGWKVKQDTEEFRVMYREGPEGTPFHTLLVEGYVDGPLDVCLCISWESGLYNKWWPQTAIPTFKIISSRCLQRVRTGEQISLVRMKVSWPLSSREAVVHYFVFEYFQDDLIVVLLNSISDSETIDRRTHGFTRAGIPDADEVVRIDVVGGFAFQKVTADRSYFRTIVNMDVKLDFVPPSIINFASRQLLGSGFKLYKKEIASVSKGDQKFCEALKDPLYARIREGLYTRSQDSGNLKRGTSVMLQDQSGRTSEDDNAKENNRCHDSIIDSEAKDLTLRDRNELNGPEGRETIDNCTLKSSSNSSTDDDQITEKCRPNKEVFVRRTERVEASRTNSATESDGTEIEKKITISPAVEQALETLDKVISIFQDRRSDREKSVNSVNLTNSDKEAEESTTLEADQMSKNCAESSKLGSQVFTSVEHGISLDNHASRQKVSSSYVNETKQNKIAPDEDPSTPSNSNHKTDNTLENALPNSDAKPANGERVTKRKIKKSRFCCSHFSFNL